jgi:hypothetical protein
MLVDVKPGKLDVATLPHRHPRVHHPIGMTSQTPRQAKPRNGTG